MDMFDKSGLAPHLVEKQKAKGTYDSSCMSICNYAGEEQICQTCFMKKEEKVQWKVADQSKKEELAAIIKKRQQENS